MDVGHQIKKLLQKETLFIWKEMNVGVNYTVEVDAQTKTVVVDIHSLYDIEDGAQFPHWKVYKGDWVNFLNDMVFEPKIQQYFGSVQYKVILKKEGT